MLQFQICKRKAEFTGRIILLFIYLMPPQNKAKLNPKTKTKHKTAKLQRFRLHTIYTDCFIQWILREAIISSQSSKDLLYLLRVYHLCPKPWTSLQPQCKILNSIPPPASFLPPFFPFFLTQSTKHYSQIRKRIRRQQSRARQSLNSVWKSPVLVTAYADNRNQRG